MEDEIVVVAASNDQKILDGNLRRSPCIASGQVRLRVEWNATSASIAYNSALDATHAPVVVFAHQDVYFPRGWEQLLQRRIAEVARGDPNWGVIGALGVGLDGRVQGPVWSTSLGQIVGVVRPASTVVQSLDELLIVVRRSAGLRFDEALPNFHLYGLDIVQIARAAGLASYVVPLPLVHNDKAHPALGEDFWQAYRFLAHKWKHRLPIRSPIVKLARGNAWRLRSWAINLLSARVRQEMALATDVDPAEYAAACGWTDLGAVDGRVRMPRVPSGA